MTNDDIKKFISQAHTVSMNKKETNQMRKALESFAVSQQSPSTKIQSPYIPRFNMSLFAKRSVSFALVFGLLIIGSDPVSASALPGEALYPVKLIHEEITASTKTSPEAKAAYEITRTEKRIQEATQLTKQDELDTTKQETIAKTIEKHTDKITEHVAEIKEEDPKRALAVQTQLETALAENTEKLLEAQKEKIQEENPELVEEVIEEEVSEITEDGIEDAEEIPQDETEASENQTIADTETNEELEDPATSETEETVVEDGPADSEIEPFVTVHDTASGRINVREEASTDSQILNKAISGESYVIDEILDADSEEDFGWYRITGLDTDDVEFTGWISAEYATMTTFEQETSNDEQSDETDSETDNTESEENLDTETNEESTDLEATEETVEEKDQIEIKAENKLSLILFTLENASEEVQKEKEDIEEVIEKQEEQEGIEEALAQEIEDQVIEIVEEPETAEQTEENDPISEDELEVNTPDQRNKLEDYIAELKLYIEIAEPIETNVEEPASIEGDELSIDEMKLQAQTFLDNGNLPQAVYVFEQIRKRVSPGADPILREQPDTPETDEIYEGEVLGESNEAELEVSEEAQDQIVDEIAPDTETNTDR